MGFMNGKVEGGKILIGSLTLGDTEIQDGEVIVGFVQNHGAYQNLRCRSNSNNGRGYWT